MASFAKNSLHFTAFALSAVWLVSACSSEPKLTREELLIPETCMDCHPKHYEEWKSSMHAYAADDPVFLAMNRRGQRELGSDLGDFCIKCHAPMALIEGATTDGLNLDEVPQHLKGVTCYFCHNVAAVEGTHNNPLRLANDRIMRGGVRDPVSNDGHKSMYSGLLDSNSCESSALCGSCHDIVTPGGVHLERTYSEFKDTVFNQPFLNGGVSCGNCHMLGDADSVIADVEGVPRRTRRDHAFPGVDVAITDWPGKDLQLEGIERDLQGALTPTLCVSPVDGGKVEFNIDNTFVGHSWPSGSAHDRRAWVELVVYGAGDTVLLESGVVAEGQAVADLADPNLVQIRDFGRDDNNEVAHMFWDVTNVDSALLPPSVTNDCADPRFNHSVTYDYLTNGAFAIADIVRIEARVHLRPIGLDVIDDLIGSGDLDASFRDQFPTFTLEGTEIQWTPGTAAADGCVTRAAPPQCPQDPKPRMECELPGGPGPS